RSPAQSRSRQNSKTVQESREGNGSGTGRERALNGRTAENDSLLSPFKARSSPFLARFLALTVTDLEFSTGASRSEHARPTRSSGRFSIGRSSIHVREPSNRGTMTTERLSGCQLNCRAFGGDRGSFSVASARPRASRLPDCALGPFH